MVCLAISIVDPTSVEDLDGATTLASARATLQAHVWAGRTRRAAYVEDADDVDDDSSEDRTEETDDELSSSDGEDNDSDIEYPPYTPREVLSESFMYRLRQEGKIHHAAE